VVVASIHETRPLRCAQIVPKICQKNQNVSKDIEVHRNPGALENAHFTRDIHYYLYFSFLRGFLHTVEVRGSSPLSPTKPSSETPISFASPLDCSRGITKKIVLESYRFFRRRLSACRRVNST